MQSNPTPDEQTEDTGAGESAHTASNAASSQADATASMTTAEVPEGEAGGAGQSTLADDAAVPSPS